MTRLCLAIGLLFFSLTTQAYPQFIGYKYASCLTCHYNSQGNGPINDYGRALWASEIAGRLFAGKKSAEQLGESSGFLGKTQMPWWFRPGVKARQLRYTQNPGGVGEDTRNIMMQAEANAAVFFDQDQKHTVVASFGYVPEPYRLRGSGEKSDEWISREHYYRWMAHEDLWVYFGMMDKAFGIRNVDHTAVNRRPIGLGQNDQTHGIMIHKIREGWEGTLHLFGGNMYQDAEYRQMGASGMFEYDIREMLRIGTSVLYQKNDFFTNQRVAVHSKYGLGHGSALLFETGIVMDEPKTGDKTQGYYVYSEAMQKVVRGYHVFVSGQSSKGDMTGTQTDQFRFGAGLLAFPMQRLEFRLEVQNGRGIRNSAVVPKDTWNLLAQVHVSL